MIFIMDNNLKYYLTITEVASGYKVQPKDILQWIEEGKLKGFKQEDNKYLVSSEDYQRFGSSFPLELRIKLGEYQWNEFEEKSHLVQKHVCEKMGKNSQILLDRDETAIKLLEKLHRIYEPQMVLYDDQRGVIASFIIFARIISLLYSTVKLLRSAIPSETYILLRPLWEAILLARYFKISEDKKDNEKEIKAWFNDEISPQPSVVRNYIAQTTELPIQTLRELYNGYSKPVHHTYRTIMDMHSIISMEGFLGEYSKSYGFDYNQSTKMSDIATLICAFENLLLSSLQAFLLCFISTLPLKQDESMLIKNEMDFYSKDQLERMDIVFNKINPKSD